jgi:hypothetical protein
MRSKASWLVGVPETYGTYVAGSLGLIVTVQNSVHIDWQLEYDTKHY